MTQRANQRPDTFAKPSYWSNDPVPAPKVAENDEAMSPTRYGDWEKKGLAIDF